MIIYSKTKSAFINDVFNNVLVDELVGSLKAKKVPGTGPAHIRSYQNSLRFMDTVLHDAAIPSFCKRVDFITATPKDTFDMLVVDEAHRLNEKSGMMQNQGENQVKEIINSAKCSVFFLDEDQKGCNGSQGYLAWLDNTLQKRGTANTRLGAEEYDFRVVDSAAGLRDLIFERNKLMLAPRPAAEAAPQSIAAKLKKLFNVELEVPAALKYVDYLPVYSLEAACGNFGKGMAVEPQGWIKCPPGVKPDHNMFAAKVAGRSMEPRIEDGDYCVFRANVVGSRNNKLVLVQHRGICDPDTGGSYTVKKYTSKKKYNKDGTWQHEEIILKPLNPDYSDIVIPNAEDEEFMVVAEVVAHL